MAKKSSPAVKAARRFLEFVGHLHDRGYQQARIIPFVTDGPAPYWCCELLPASRTRHDHGGMTAAGLECSPIRFNVRHARYTPWPQFLQQSDDEALAHLLDAFPTLASSMRAADLEYATWFQEMLRLTAPDGLVASAVYWEQPPNRMYIFNVNAADQVHVPVPPLFCP